MNGNLDSLQSEQLEIFSELTTQQKTLATMINKRQIEDRDTDRYFSLTERRRTTEVYEKRVGTK